MYIHECLSQSRLLFRHHSNTEYFGNNLHTFESSSFKPWVFCKQFTYLWIVIIQTLSILRTIYLPLNRHHSNLEYIANNLLTFESSSFKPWVFCKQFIYVWIVIIQTLSILPTIYLPLNCHHSNLEYFANNLLTFESSSFKHLEYFANNLLTFESSSFKPWVFCQQFTYLWIVIIQTLSVLRTIYSPLNRHHSNSLYTVK